MDSVCPDYISTDSRILFNGIVSPKLSYFPKPYGCFNDKALFIGLLINSQKNDSLNYTKSIIEFQDKKYSLLKYSKKSNLRRRQFVMKIYRSSKYNENEYVLIRLQRIGETLDFFFELNKHGRVIRWCQGGKF